MNIIPIANQLNMSYVSYYYYIKHNMCAVEWKLNAMIKKSKFIQKV